MSGIAHILRSLENTLEIQSWTSPYPGESGAHWGGDQKEVNNHLSCKW